MRIPLEQALQTTQMIVPEVDLHLKVTEGRVDMAPVPMTDWFYYLANIEAISECVLDEMEKMPDVQPVTELLDMLEDLRCLTASIGLFYQCTMREIENIRTPHNDKMKRLRRYRKALEEEEE